MSTLRIVTLTVFLTLALSAVAFAERPEVSADRQSFDVATMRYLLDGHVTVRFPERTITADHAQVNLVTMEVWAQDHIRLVEGDILFTGKTLYVKGSERTAYLKDGADFTRSALAIRSDEATFNWDTKIADFTSHPGKHHGKIHPRPLQRRHRRSVTHGMTFYGNRSHRRTLK